MSERRELLHRIAEFREPVGPLVSELRKLPFDWDGSPLLLLRPEHFEKILDRFLSGDIAPSQLEEWAESLESRDDVAFEPEYAALLSDLQFRLANPTINGKLSTAVVKEMRSNLVAATSNKSWSVP